MSTGPLPLIQTLHRVGALGGLTDGQLLERFVGRRDEVAQQAFSVLVERHGATVLRVCRGVLRDVDDAQDAFQATFLILIRKADAVRNRDSIGSWLFGVALRVARRARADAARRLAREGKEAERTAARVGPCDAPRLDWETAEDHQALLEEVHRLPARYREPVRLCYLEGHSTEEAARRLGCPRGTVLSRLARARERLRERLVQRGVAPSVLLGSARTLPHAAVTPPLIKATVAAAMSLCRARPTRGVTIAARMTQALHAHKGTRWVSALAALFVLGATLAPEGRPRHEPPSAPKAAASDSTLARRLGPRLEAPGVVVVDRPGVRTVRASAVAPLPDGKAVVAAVTGRSEQAERLFLGRFNPDGTTDQTFGKDGFVEAGFRPEPRADFNSSRPRVLIQPDGKILLASTALVPDRPFRKIGFQRFHPDGAPDSSFGRNCVVLLDVVAPDRDGTPREWPAYLSGLALQADGRIVAGGAVLGPGGDDRAFFVTRLEGSGAIDESFGEAGRTITAFPVILTEPTYPQKTTRIVSRADASDLAIGRDGRIAVGGHYEPLDGFGNVFNLAVAVYGSNGRLDPTFGDGGRLRFDFGTESGSWPEAGVTSEVATALAFAADGDLLVAGGVAPGHALGTIRVFASRFDASGRLVPTFGDGGVTFVSSPEGCYARALLIQRDGAIVVGGTARRPFAADQTYPFNERGDLFLVRLRADGRLDRGFGTDGQLREDIRAFELVEGVAERPDGTILATGYTFGLDGRTSLVLMPAPDR